MKAADPMIEDVVTIAADPPFKDVACKWRKSSIGLMMWHNVLFEDGHVRLWDIKTMIASVMR